MALQKAPAPDLLSGALQTATAPRYSTDLVRRREVRQEVSAPAWIEGNAVSALLARDEALALTADEPASFLPGAAPASAVSVRATGEPPRPWDVTALVVRFRSAAASPRRTAGWLQLPRKVRQILVVPSGAVLPSADGPYVLVASGGGYARRPIEVGRTFSGFTAVVGGVRPGEQVVSINAFFLDAERRLRGAGAR
jgi:hypothetical protein